MSKLTKQKIELIRQFAERFDCSFEVDGKEITLEQAIDVFNGEQPKEKTLEERRADFVESLRPYAVKYGSDMLNKFYKYWAVVYGNEMKFEGQKSWDVEKRLAKWYQNDLEYERQRYIQQLNSKL